MQGGHTYKDNYKQELIQAYHLKSKLGKQKLNTKIMICKYTHEFTDSYTDFHIYNFLFPPVFAKKYIQFISVQKRNLSHKRST